jgi:hypothetical protein
MSLFVEKKWDGGLKALVKSMGHVLTRMALKSLLGKSLSDNNESYLFWLLYRGELEKMEEVVGCVLEAVMKVFTSKENRSQRDEMRC